MIPSVCNFTPFVGVLDYAYLATNVYHDSSENKLLGLRPGKEKNFHDFAKKLQLGKSGWFQITHPAVNLNLASPFYADLYVKVYKHKIQHIMVAFRGTVPKIHDNLKEDAVTWCVDFLEENNNNLDPLPSYWYQVCGFILSVSHVLRELDAMQLLAPQVGYHVTGHSLGGALANLVSAKAIILTSPTHMQSRVSPVANVISFNAPGVGSMPIAASTFHEHRVITMRAKYDTVSRIGKPYGYIIDNIVPESYEACKHAFEFEHVAQMVKTPLPGDMSSEIVTTFARDVLHAIAGVEDKHLIDQHSMANLLKVICAQSCCASLNFLRLRHWADMHGGLNHDFKAEPLWGHAHVAKAA